MTEFGSFVKPRPKEYRKENKETHEVNVVANAIATQRTSCREVENQVGISKSKTHRILKKYKVKPYKFKIVHNLHQGDSQRRITFCRWFINNTVENTNFGKTVIWSDEAHISSAGIFNRHNTRYWSVENHHFIHEREQQGRFGFNVSCFILGTEIKYYIFEENLTAQRYLEILRFVVPSLLDDVPLATRPNIYLQQDGCPAHNSGVVRDFLDEKFPGRWIGTYGPVKWPARSPDLSILDFFVWGFLKNKIYKRRYNNQNELRIATIQALTELQNHRVFLSNAIKNITKRTALCLEKNGSQIEQYL